MKVSFLAQHHNMKVITNHNFLEREITGCYIGDLLSLAMSKVQEGDAWITVQTNINIIAVAMLTECACIIVPEGIDVDQSIVAKANANDIVILSSEKTSYEIAKQMSELL